MWLFGLSKKKNASKIAFIINAVQFETIILFFLLEYLPVIQIILKKTIGTFYL